MLPGEKPKKKEPKFNTNNLMIDPKFLFADGNFKTLSMKQLNSGSEDGMSAKSGRSSPSQQINSRKKSGAPEPLSEEVKDVLKHSKLPKPGQFSRFQATLGPKISVK